MYCPKCYRLNDENNRYCSNCGYELNRKSGDGKQIKKVSFCENCGAELKDGAAVCPGCGSKKRERSMDTDKNFDSATIIMCVASFLIPLVGLILFCVMYNKAPQKANRIGLSALARFLLEIIFFAVVLIVY